MWLATLAQTGYGRMSLNGRSTEAHRISYQLYVGAIPNGLHVMHKCDNRQCVNPDHLRLGTNADNHLDKCSKGRQHQGASHYKAKLSTEQLDSIRKDARPQSAIAKDWNVSQSFVSKIKTFAARRAS